MGKYISSYWHYYSFIHYSKRDGEQIKQIIGGLKYVKSAGIT